MSIDSLVTDYTLPLYIPQKRQQDYVNYRNIAEKMPWNVKDIHFQELSRGLCGYCEALSTKAIVIGNWLKQDMPELAKTLLHEKMHEVNSWLSEYAVRARENNAFAHILSHYAKQKYYN
jgi:hypothetical protein